MRFYFPDIARPKSAAKLLRRLNGNIKLSKALETIASATGYRDWYELTHTQALPSQRPDRQPVEVVVAVIRSISHALKMSIGDVHYAMAKSRLLAETPLSLDDMLKVRAMLWRSEIFGPPARGKPGTVVRLNSDGQKGVAYLKAYGRPTYVVLDNGVGVRADFEIITPRQPLADFVPSRLWLPYGVWTLSDGSTVTFSRDYKPLWHIKLDQIVRMEPWIWVHGIVKQSFFSGEIISEMAWEKNPARCRAIEHLEKNRLLDPPKLLDAMPILFEAGVDSISDAVERMEERQKIEHFPAKLI